MFKAFFSEYQFFAFFKFADHVVLVTPRKELSNQVGATCFVFPYGNRDRRIVSEFNESRLVVKGEFQVIDENIEEKSRCERSSRLIAI